MLNFFIGLLQPEFPSWWKDEGFFLTFLLMWHKTHFQIRMKRRCYSVRAEMQSYRVEWCDSLKKNTCIVSHKSDSKKSKKRSVLSWISPFLLQTFFFLFQVWKKKNRGVVDKSVFSSLSRNIISYLWLFSVGCVWKLVLKVTTKDQTFISRKLAVSMYISNQGQDRGSANIFIRRPRLTAPPG